MLWPQNIGTRYLKSIEFNRHPLFCSEGVAYSGSEGAESVCPPLLRNPSSSSSGMTAPRNSSLNFTLQPRAAGVKSGRYSIDSPLEEEEEGKMIGISSSPATTSRRRSAPSRNPEVA